MQNEVKKEIRKELICVWEEIEKIPYVTVEKLRNLFIRRLDELDTPVYLQEDIAD